MNPEELTRLVQMTEENNVLLKKMHRNQVISSWIRGIYVALFVISAYGGYLFIKPMLGNLLSTYSDLMSIKEGVSSTAGNMNQISDLLQQFK